MSKELEEVEIPVFMGTSGDDVILDDGYMEYFGGAGNDVFVAIGDEGQWSDEFDETLIYTDYFYGGSGSDTVTYVSSNHRIEASLETGIANRMSGVYVQSTDILDSIENIELSLLNAKPAGMLRRCSATS